MRAWLLVCVLGGAARADDVTLHWETEQASVTLELDPVFQTTLAPFDQTESLQQLIRKRFRHDDQDRLTSSRPRDPFQPHRQMRGRTTADGPAHQRRCRHRADACG